MGRNQTFPRLKGYQASSGCLERHIVWRLFSERAEGVPSPFSHTLLAYIFILGKLSLCLSPNFRALVKVPMQSLLTWELDFSCNQWLRNQTYSNSRHWSLLWRWITNSLFNCLHFLTKKTCSGSHLAYTGLPKLSKDFFFSCFLLFTCFTEIRSTNILGFLCKCDEKKWVRL